MLTGFPSFLCGSNFISLAAETASSVKPLLSGLITKIFFVFPSEEKRVASLIVP